MLVLLILSHSITPVAKTIESPLKTSHVAAFGLHTQDPERHDTPRKELQLKAPF